MNTSEIIVTLLALTGLSSFCWFLVDYWKAKQDKKNQGDFHY